MRSLDRAEKLLDECYDALGSISSAASRWNAKLRLADSYRELAKFQGEVLRLKMLEERLNPLVEVKPKPPMDATVDGVRVVDAPQKRRTR
jgi:hypothetical protein